MIVAMVVVFLILVLVGVPILFATGVPVVMYFLANDGLNIAVMAQKMYTPTNNFSMLAIPMFVLAGDLMNGGGLTKKLVELASAFMGHIKGSLCHVTVLASMLFASMSGSSAASAASIGAMMIPAMKEKKYDEGTAAALVACSAVMGPIIPPSIAFIIYCAITGDSIGQMFIAGVVPGILMGLCFMCVSYFLARHYGFPTEERCTWHERIQSLVAAIPAMMMPLIIMGGIFSGVFTASEAGAVAALYAMIIGFVTRQLTIKKLIQAFINTACTSAAILLIIGISQALAYILTIENIPALVSDLLLSFSQNWLVIFAVVVLILLVLGCFMVDAAMIPLLVPILHPIAMAVGIHPLQFGIVVCMTAIMGGVTPPVGNLLYIAAGVGEVPVGKAIKGLIPYLIALLIAITICVLVPPVTTFLPGFMGT